MEYIRIPGRLRKYLKRGQERNVISPTSRRSTQAHSLMQRMQAPIELVEGLTWESAATAIESPVFASESELERASRCGTDDFPGLDSLLASLVGMELAVKCYNKLSGRRVAFAWEEAVGGRNWHMFSYWSPNSCLGTPPTNRNVTVLYP